MISDGLAEREVFILLEDITGRPIEEIITRGLTSFEWEKVKKVAFLRKELGVPLQYLTGRAYFLDYELRVGPGVFIPRPETEVLVETVKELFGGRSVKTILEIGTGTGAISIALARIFPNARIVATDISQRALRYASMNLLRHNVKNVELRLSDVFSAILEVERFDLIVSNPPYVKRSELAALPPEVRWEPLIALDGGEDGLSVIRKILEGAVEKLTSGGAVVLEISPMIAGSLEQLAHALRYKISFQRDLDGRIRVGILER